MIPDAMTPCPACPQVVRDAYAAIGRALIDSQYDPPANYEELYLVREALRPWIEAHYADQRHALSEELASARQPALDVVDDQPRLPELEATR